MLIDLGANPFIRDKFGHNIIHIATQGDKVRSIHYLLKNYNFDANDWDDKDSSPLHWAAYLNKEVSLCYLLAWGANPNVQDMDGNTPLHLAVMRNPDHGYQTRCIRILLLKGAEWGIENYWEETPMHKIHPEAANRTEIEAILVSDVTV